MPIQIIPSESRGLTKTDWLTSYHSFNFAEYYDPSRTGFGKLRVLNDDVIAPGAGFPAHAHGNMEIITFVLSGALEHKDSTGGQGVIKEGQMQRMTAGKGIQHSEFNASKSQPVHILQIWITPRDKGLEPEYEQKDFSDLLSPDNWNVVVAPQKSPTALFIHQDVRFLLGLLDEETSLTHVFSSPDKGGYCFLIDGEVEVDGKTLGARDAAIITGQKQFELKALKPSFCLLIETG